LEVAWPAACPVKGGLVRERIHNFSTNIRNEAKSAAEQRSLELRKQLEAMQNKYVLSKGQVILAFILN
jgi:hypothetical protein